MVWALPVDRSSSLDLLQDRQAETLVWPGRLKSDVDSEWRKPRNLVSSGSVKTSPIPKVIRESEAEGGFHVEITPSEKLMIGLLMVGPIMIHSSRTDTVPNICG